jgi:hypothetical protein
MEALWPGNDYDNEDKYALDRIQGLLDRAHELYEARISV